MQAETKEQQAPPWHGMELSALIAKLGTDRETGLAAEQAAVRLRAWGKNELPQLKKTPAAMVLLRQFASPLVYILLVAAALTWWLGEYTDMTVILIVVAVNSGIGFYQEYRASRIFEALKKIVRVRAHARRAGRIFSVDSEELVPGDVIIVKNGQKVPADARLMEASNLRVSEAVLTGESMPVGKFPGKLTENIPITGQTNMIFTGTAVEKGEAVAVVTNTGARTEIGKISILTQSTDAEQSPLQLRMKKLGTFLTELFVVISAAVFLIGLASGDDFAEILTTTVAMAVAAIPEGLPAAISVILAVASQRILKRKGLVRKLIAAETLGSTNVICADKTGTLTYGRMKVERVIAENREKTLLAMALANEAEVETENGKETVHGEATDQAKLAAFLDAGGDLRQTLLERPRLGLLQFDEEKKYLAAVHGTAGGAELFATGAPEKILRLCHMPMADEDAIEKQVADLAGQGFRLIGIAAKTLAHGEGREWDENAIESQMRELSWLGLAAIRDPVRADVKDALALAKSAGIKVIMITGDHVATARAIGRELGFTLSKESVITGAELEVMNENELDQLLPKINIIARATPQHKIRIIDGWQRAGAVVAMTGDGVNDAPALKSANIGIAVGTGTDVSKEASDLVLLDDSFSTITAAIREGRTGFANIRKATVTVMSNAFTEITLITSSLVFGTAFPITAVQILWVNLALDALPVLSLAFEPPEPGLMKRKPNPPDEPILDREAKSIIFVVSIIADLALVGIFLYLIKFSGWELIKIQTFIFLATAVPTLINIFAFKSLNLPLTQIRLFSNKLLVFSVALGFALMGLAIYLPFFNGFLGTVPLPPAMIVAVFLFAFFKLAMVEVVKFKYRRRGRGWTTG